MHDAAAWQAASRLLDNLGIEHAVVDFPGFGAVAHDASIVNFDDLVAWTRGEIDRLTAGTDEPVTLLGHSCGGRIALALAVDNITYQQLILVGSPNLYRPTFKVRVIKALAKLMSPIKCFVPDVVRNKLRSDDYTQATETGMTELYQSVVADDQTALTDRVTTQMQLLWGEQDTAAPVRIAYELDQLLPHSKLTVLPNLGHNLHLENPGLLAAKIKLLLSYD